MPVAFLASRSRRRVAEACASLPTGIGGSTGIFGNPSAAGPLPRDCRAGVPAGRREIAGKRGGQCPRQRGLVNLGQIGMGAAEVMAWCARCVILKQCLF